MFTEKDFMVELVNKEEVKTFIEKHGRFASVCYNTPINSKEDARRVGLGCLRSGHFSGSRHLYFEFDLKKVPRFAVDQLVRHEVGVVKNVQSLRYVDKSSHFDIYEPPEIRNNIETHTAFGRSEDYHNNCYSLNVNRLVSPLFSDSEVVDKKRAQECARALLPIGIESECSFAINLEGLIHLANVRLCERAELPIRHMVKLMCDEVVKVEPKYQKYLVANCVKLGKCPEGKMTCGKLSKGE